MRIIHLCGIAASCILLLAGTAVAQDFTGTWEGKYRCRGLGYDAGGRQKLGVSTKATLQISQNGDDLNMQLTLLGEPSSRFDGEVEATDRPGRAEMIFISCTTNVSFNLTNLRLHDNEMGHGRASVLPGGTSRISALSVLRDSAVGGIGGRCSWNFVRIDDSDPGVGSCF